MSVSSIASSPSVAALIRDRNSAESALKTAVQSADAISAQQSLSIVQTSTLAIQTKTGGTGAQNGPLPFQDPTKNNLTAIMNALQSSDIKSAQTAYQQMQTNVTATPTVSGAVTSMAVSPTPTSTGAQSTGQDGPDDHANDNDGDDAQPAAARASMDISPATQNARAAYTQLMSIAQSDVAPPSVSQLLS